MQTPATCKEKIAATMQMRANPGLLRLAPSTTSHIAMAQ
jgi:hypothetical protein